LKPYVGRFAPSPTGPLHMGSLVTALGSWLDARSHDGTWLIRIEDVDHERCSEAFTQKILTQLSHLGLESDGPILYQSQRHDIYWQYAQVLEEESKFYACQCSRKSITLSNLVNAALDQTQQALTHPPVYSGTCKALNLRSMQSDLNPILNFNGAIRIHVPQETIEWTDRRLGRLDQKLALEVGDFVIKRKDGPFSYQWAVVVDDIEQHVTHVVRGEDLADNTPRQIFLYQQLNHLPPSYLHLALVKNELGQKLSKQTLAPELDLTHPLDTLKIAAQHLGLKGQASNIASSLLSWTEQWQEMYPGH
jgi:glutamyl-Q tRNA(Asp) synthetase